jgi:hypothetical protein
MIVKFPAGKCIFVYQVLFHTNLLTVHFWSLIFTNLQHHFVPAFKIQLNNSQNLDYKFPAVEFVYFSVLISAFFDGKKITNYSQSLSILKNSVKN